MAQHHWEKSYPAGLSWGDPLPEPIPLEGYLLGAAQRIGDRPLIDFYDRVLTFAQVSDLAGRVAKGLQALGVGPGVNVGLYLPNTPHYAACFFGTLMAGG
ncbi:MAG: AMP-binding protein, partial [Steroidobacteraceae bacterium]